MDTSLATNLLFYVLSIFFILAGLGFLIFMVFVIMVLKTLWHILEILRRQEEKVMEDIDAIRQKVKNGGATIASFIMHTATFFKRKKK